MRFARRVLAATLAGMLLVTLAGCSADRIIWGPDGAHVIETTEQLIEAARSGKTVGLSCEGSSADFGTPQDWDGLSAGEPERFRADYWPDQAALSPAWSINLEFGAVGALPSRFVPSDVFFRTTDIGLCVIDVTWSTVTFG